MEGVKFKHFANSNTQECVIGNKVWSVARLIHLSKDLIPFDLPIQHLCINLNYNEMTMRDLIGHIKSVLDSDLEYPIIMDEDGEIMDGNHRIMKAIIEEKESIKVVRFIKTPDPCSIREE